MKEPLKAPFIFALIILATTAVLAVLQVLAAWGLAAVPAPAVTLAEALRRLPRAVLDVIVPSVVLSVILVGFRMARRPFSRFVGLLIVLVVGYAALVNGMIWMRALAAGTTAAAEVPARTLRPWTFARVGGAEVAVSAIDGPSIRGLLAWDPARTPRFTVAGTAAAAVRAGTLTITPAARASAAITGDAAPAWAGVFDADRFSAAFLRDIGAVTTDLERLLARAPGEFFAACFALVFLCAASLALLRLTRWPLVNVTLLLAAARGYFSLWHLLAVRLAPQVQQAFSDSLAARLAPAGALAAIGVVLLLVDIVFIPADRWVRPEGA